MLFGSVGKKAGLLTGVSPLIDLAGVIRFLVAVVNSGDDMFFCLQNDRVTIWISKYFHRKTFTVIV